MTRLTFVPEDSIPYSDSLHQSTRLKLKAALNMANFDTRAPSENNKTQQTTINGG